VARLTTRSENICRRVRRISAYGVEINRKRSLSERRTDDYNDRPVHRVRSIRRRDPVSDGIDGRDI